MPIEDCTCDDCRPSDEDEYIEDYEDSRSNDERAIPPDLASKATFQPFARLLRRGGRYFSCEVEVNGIDSYDAQRALGCDSDGYSYKSSETGSIVATDDCTCDAEIKIGKMRDGATITAAAANVYDTLRQAGAYCGFNTGHHVHVDAARITQLGTEAIETVLSASLALASACNPTLVGLAATGYSGHRDTSGHGYAGTLKDSPSRAMTDRTAWHASNARYCASDYPYSAGIPTFEYRLPNGTTYAIRGHAHAAVALGLLDFGERVLDEDPEALDYLRHAEDKLSHAGEWNAPDGASILTRALHLHTNSLTALNIAAHTSPLDAQTRQVFALAAA